MQIETNSPQREPKHMGIVSATNRLRQVKDQADELLERINDGSSSLSKQSAEAREHPGTLLVVLNDSGNEIAEITERISAILTLIEESLF